MVAVETTQALVDLALARRRVTVDIDNLRRTRNALVEADACCRWAVSASPCSAGEPGTEWEEAWIGLTCGS